VFAGLAIVAMLAGATACQRSESGDSAVQVQTAVERAKVSAQQVREWMGDGEQLVILDSRSIGAWESGSTKAKGAIRVPPLDVASRLADIPTDGRIIVYCT